MRIVLPKSHTSLSIIVFALASSLLSTTTMGSDQSDPPADAKPLSAPELLQLFGNKTWKWGEGGGYFRSEGRKFLARTVSDKGTTTAQGKWRITDFGRLCFDADWVTTTGSYPATTCFLHVVAGQQIYQRKLPDGGWYIFRHAEPEPSDEYSKLVKQDLVSTALQSAKQRSTEH